MVIIGRYPFYSVAQSLPYCSSSPCASSAQHSGVRNDFRVTKNPKKLQGLVVSSTFSCSLFSRCCSIVGRGVRRVNFNLKLKPCLFPFYILRLLFPALPSNSHVSMVSHGKKDTVRITYLYPTPGVCRHDQQKL